MEQIRASSLNSFNKCPRAYFELEFDGKQEDLFFGTIQHYGARGYNIDRWLDYYCTNINPDMVLKTIGKNLSEKIQKRTKEMKDNATEHHEEVPFLYKHDEVYLEGTADFIFLRDGLWYVVDYKTAKNSDVYTKGKVWDEYAQHYCYVYLFCEYFKVNEAIFIYIPLEKNNSARVLTNACMRTITKKQAKEKVDQIITDYTFAKQTGIYEERINSGCRFCKLKDVCQKYYDANLSCKIIE